jgi:hypothetical protein
VADSALDSMAAGVALPVGVRLSSRRPVEKKPRTERE